MLTVLEIIRRTTEFLDKHGVESARLNAELLIGHALGLKRMQLYLQFERPLTEAELATIRPLVKRRSGREPLQYILGETEFAGLRLKVDRRALIPRPETEYLLEVLAERLPAVPAQILDLGTGTGALALALAKRYPAARVLAVDRSESALALARENSEQLGLGGQVTLQVSDWFAALPADARFNLIVSNPPYLSEAEVQAAEPEVRDHEPRSALVAGGDGADDLVAIISGARKFMAPGGVLACETGSAQHSRLLALAGQAGYVRTESVRDLTGRDRFVLAFG
jgi:release factor glutamine methyltransferase